MTLNDGKGTLLGTFSIRKQTQEVTLQITTDKKADGSVPLSATITGELKCSAFGVARPSLLFVKIKDVVKLQIDLKLAPQK